MTPADRFESDWLAATTNPPDLGAYVPDGIAMRTATLLELIRIDHRNRATRPRLAKPLRSYADEFPELRGADIAELLGVDDDPSTLAEPTEIADRTAAVASSLAVTSFAETAASTQPHLDTDPLERLDVGQRIDDFDLIAPLGSGAFARVFLAKQLSMQRMVAVKISADRGSEAQTLAQLDHEYIVRVFDQRVVGDSDLRLLYMQYLPGGTLLDVVRRLRATTWTPGRTGQVLLDAVDHAMLRKGEVRPTDSSVRDEIAERTWPETVAWLGRRLAEALEYANGSGVLHRDIKPANVLLTAEGVPKLADFNISYSAELAKSGTSPATHFGGSIAYMSPEQLAAVHPGDPTSPADLDTRSDIYSLGVVLWELLTGRKPFPVSDSSTLDDMLAARRAGVGPEELADLPPDTPATLRRILLTCLAPDPDKRYRCGADLAHQFEICLDPRARELVDPPHDSWRSRALRARLPIIVACTLLPNLTSVFANIQQNELLVFRKLSDEARERVQQYAVFSNPIAFLLGTIVLVYLLRRVLALRPTDPADNRLGRRDVLKMGDRVVLVTFGLWMIPGTIFPFLIENADPTVPVRAYVHFLAAQVLCSAMAVTYPFFLLTFLSTRCIYPSYLPYTSIDATDGAQLRALARRGNLYLVVAAAIPLVTVAGVTFLNAEEVELVIVAVRVLCIGGIAAFMLSYYLFRLTERDLRALAALAH